jgi:hypothetical protein
MAARAAMLLRVEDLKLRVAKTEAEFGVEHLEVRPPRRDATAGQPCAAWGCR